MNPITETAYVRHTLSKMTHGESGEKKLRRSMKSLDSKESNSSLASSFKAPLSSRFCVSLPLQKWLSLQKDVLFCIPDASIPWATIEWKSDGTDSTNVVVPKYASTWRIEFLEARIKLIKFCIVSKSCCGSYCQYSVYSPGWQNKKNKLPLMYS